MAFRQGEIVMVPFPYSDLSGSKRRPVLARKTKARAGKAKDQEEVISDFVRDLFGNVHRLMRQQMEANGIDFTTSIEPETLELTADPRLIEQVLINIVLNAIQALGKRPGSKIEMLAKIDERGRVAIQVADNGPGILDEVLDKIFIPFFTTKQEGSGIGLSLCRQIMRLHRGTIHASSVVGVRTEVTLRF